MGSSLAMLRLNSSSSTPAKQCPILLCALGKLREYHGLFKNICNNFCLDSEEFGQIFGEGTSGFNIWDSDDNAVIDALDLFSGLILFGDSKAEEKIRCMLVC